jgi:hypothetical protein
MRQFMSNGKTYSGFDQDLTGSRLNRVALVRVEYQVEVFALDDSREAETNLVKYLCEQDYYSEYATVLGIYERRTGQ